MSILKERGDVLAAYARAARNKWVVPCFCSENLTTTEAILKAASDYGREKGIERIPVIIAITCNYGHRAQAANYTATRLTGTGLRLFTSDLHALAGEGCPYAVVDVMIHLDHIQYDTDREIYGGDLTPYASIMFDASALPLEENIRLTAEFVRARGREIVVEGACDEIIDAGGNAHNALTTPENAERYFEETGVDLIVANLGTEHRASAQNLQYHGEAAREIEKRTGPRIVLHGTSSVPAEQVKNLYADGVCKVNIWTLLERDSTPALFESMVKNAVKNAGPATVKRLIAEGYLTEKALEAEKADIACCTTVYRQDIVFGEMVRLCTGFFRLWYR